MLPRRQCSSGWGSLPRGTSGLGLGRLLPEENPAEADTCLAGRDRGIPTAAPPCPVHADPCPSLGATVDCPRPLPAAVNHSCSAPQAWPQCTAVLGASLCPGPGPQGQVAEQDPAGAQLLRHRLLELQGCPRVRHRGQVSLGSRPTRPPPPPSFPWACVSPGGAGWSGEGLAEVVGVGPSQAHRWRCPSVGRWHVGLAQGDPQSCRPSEGSHPHVGRDFCPKADLVSILAVALLSLSSVRLCFTCFLEHLCWARHCGRPSSPAL